MPGRRPKRWLASVGILLGGCVMGPGCHQTPLTAVCAPGAPVVRMAGPDSHPEPASASAVLTPHSVVQWHITSGRGKPMPATQSQSMVTDDGQLDLGPYGSVHVGGMTPQEASNAIARHLSKYVDHPQVHLKAMIYSGAAARDSRTPGGADVARTGWRTNPPSSTTLTRADLPALDPPIPLTLAPGQEPSADKPKAEKEKEKEKEPAGKSDQAPAAAVPPGPGFVGPPGAAPGPPGGHPGAAANELAKVALPPYVIEPPDILLVEYVPPEAEGLLKQSPVFGQHLVRPDGMISLGIYGTVPVAGLTLDQARYAIAQKLSERIKDVDVTRFNVDVLAYNSKVYYVITDGAGFGEQVYRFPVTGSETVLDALSQIGGLPPVASKKHIWVARRTPDGGPPHILPVDWIGTTQGGLAGTNYQVMPGDRIYVRADCWRTFDTNVAKVLSPFERMLGATLLGSEVVNSIRSGGRGGGTGTTGTTR